MNAVLFLSTVLIWGTTWIAISMQVGPVPVLVSVFWRFALAGGLFVAGLAVLGRLTRPAGHQQPWILAQALCLFSLNFLCFYRAEALIPSGLVSVVFSLATIFNALHARLFFGDAITRRALIAGGLGVSGLICLFLPDLDMAGAGKTLAGMGLAALGTWFFSLGNMVSRRNSAAGITPITANAWGMVYGAVILLGMIALTGTPLSLPRTPVYLGALGYLAVIGSIVGFTTYLMMVARIGATRAAYATVLFPVVALLISTVVEGYRWDWLNALGLALALAGNVVMFGARRRAPIPTPPSAGPAAGLR